VQVAGSHSALASAVEWLQHGAAASTAAFAFLSSFFEPFAFTNSITIAAIIRMLPMLINIFFIAIFNISFFAKNIKYYLISKLK
jgi:hypothetical protein